MGDFPVRDLGGRLGSERLGQLLRLKVSRQAEAEAVPRGSVLGTPVRE